MSDHHVLDGSMLARTLQRIEAKLTSELVAELRSLA